MKLYSKIYGLVGHPLKHSFSPLMHNAAFKKLKIPGEYHLFQKEPEELESFLNRLEDENIWGLNVTIPYKEKVLDFGFIELDRSAPYAKEIRAINTIVKKGKSLKGFNTDVAGFLRHLNKLNFNPINKRVAILGAGGAGKAVAYAVAKKGVSQIAIFDIDKDKAEGVSLMLGELFPELNISVVERIEQLDMIHKDLLINATPIGLAEDDPCLIEDSMLHEDLFVYDLIYNPSPTKLLSLAKDKGLSCSDGLGMLVYQGAFSFIYFTDTLIPYAKIVEVMWEAIDEALGRK
ncbi:MAG: shikimate dehydrogenase [Candidatus Omnitrophica bacterium]|nr:shikimate dehydrogenase [Candidatus Omnitrophota bacterium]